MMTLKFSLILLIIVPLAHTAFGQVLNNSSTPIVCSNNIGCLRGSLKEGYIMPVYEAFMGIPYALPPVGNLRFSPPQEYPKFNDVFDALEPKSDCIQKNYLFPGYPVSGSEDCLYLNVYRPRRSHRSVRKLPVMVYIHGGGWFSGSVHPGITGPEYFMDRQEVLLVTFNYRLGAFGFLSTGDENIPGNLGLKDQVLALKWVHNNIEAFGGDPARVTLFGQSVGAVTAHMHMLSPLSRGLFQGVICLSGTANVPFAINYEPLQQAIRTAELSGIENAKNLNSRELSEALRAVDANTLLNAGDGLKFWSVDHITNYRPVVEPADAKNAFLTRYPEELLKSGDYQAVPFMVGVVPNEGAVRALAIVESQELTTSFNSDFFNLLKTLLELPAHFNEQQLNDKTHRVIQEYFNGEQALNDNTKLEFINIFTQRGFHQPFYNTIKHFVNTIDTKVNPIYLYSFNYTGPYSFAALYTGGVSKRNYGVVHCDDLIYLFKSPALFPEFPKRSHYAKAIRALTRNLVQFAKFRRPLPTVDVNSCIAESFHSGPNRICDYQLFDGGFTSENKFNVDRVHFWDEILKI